MSEKETEQKAREVQGKGKGELEQKVQKVQERYGHLLTREAALADLDAAEGTSAGSSFEARVLRIFAPYEFERGSRKGRVCRVELERTGSPNERPMLVLWDADVEKLQKREIAVGDMISISNSYLKEGEYHVGRQGSVRRVERASAADAKKAEREARSERLAVIKELRASGKSLEAVVELDGKH